MGWQIAPPTTQLAVLPGLAVPTAVVQAATPAVGASPVSVAFANPVGAGNTVIVTVFVNNASACTVTPASGPDTFTTDANVNTTPGHNQFFHVSNSAGGYSSVKATLGGNTLFVYAYELIGTVTFDTTASSSSGTASFSVNFTPATTAEFLAAMAAEVATATLTTPPAAPWVNETVLTSGGSSAVGSYQFVSSNSAVTYSGTWSSGVLTGAIVGGYKLTNPGGTVPANECILYYFGGSLYALGPSGNPVLLATT